MNDQYLPILANLTERSENVNQSLLTYLKPCFIAKKQAYKSDKLHVVSFRNMFNK